MNAIYTDAEIAKMVARKAKFTNVEYSTNLLNEVLTENMSEQVRVATLLYWGFITLNKANKMLALLPAYTKAVA